MEKIQVNSSAPWNPKTDDRAAHVYYAANQEDQVNKVLISMYNKKRQLMNVQTSLPKGDILQNVLLKSLLMCLHLRTPLLHPTTAPTT